MSWRMKKDTHPPAHNVIFRDVSAGVDFVTTSTLKSSEVEKVNGEEYYVIHVEVSSSSHPFYTGKEQLVDTAGRVEKFRAKEEKAGKK